MRVVQPVLATECNISTRETSVFDGYLTQKAVDFSGSASANISGQCISASQPPGFMPHYQLLAAAGVYLSGIFEPNQDKLCMSFEYVEETPDQWLYFTPLLNIDDTASSRIVVLPLSKKPVLPPYPPVSQTSVMTALIVVAGPHSEGSVVSQTGSNRTQNSSSRSSGGRFIRLLLLLFKT